MSGLTRGAIAACCRERLASVLPEGVRLRRARGDWLFRLDAREAVLPDDLPGFERRDTLVRPDAGFLLAWERRHPDPPDDFARSLVRFAGRTPTDAAIACFAALARYGEASDANERAACDRRVRQLAALGLRGDPGGLYACALARFSLMQESE